MVDRSLQVLFSLIGTVCAALGVGYFLQLGWALNTWPWADGRLSNIFVSSVLAAVAAAMMWIGVSGRLAGAAGGLLHVATMLGGFATVLLPLGQQRTEPGLMAYAMGFALVAIGAVVAFAWVRRRPVRDTRPLPLALRIWCILYILILIPAGAAMILRVPGIMPWPVKPETSMLYGWVFVAAAWSFAYPLLRPQVEHIRVGLIGFLAYDAVLLAPFARHFEKVRSELFNSLALYVVALSVSAGVSIYFLFLSRDTSITLLVSTQCRPKWSPPRH